jgi:hypothetical protein
MEIYVIEGFGERLLAHPWGFQRLDAVAIAQDARFPGTGAQGVGYFGGPPMGSMSSGCFLHGPCGSLTPRRLAAKYDNCQDRSMAPADHAASLPRQSEYGGPDLGSGVQAGPSVV